jgi:hypothetical protein
MRPIFSWLLLCTVLLAPVTRAQTSEFSIRVFPGDEEAPTAPTLLSTTPITSTQVDVDWSDSTDNFLVQGYALFRNGVPLATTTLTSYTDSGLTASTTYSYFVYAFDYSYNYSSSSNSLSTTTPNPPPTGEPSATSSNQTQSTATRVVLDNFDIVEDYTSAQFFIKTARPARVELRWGRTTSYELGYVINNHFTSEYKTTVTGLEPCVTYEYEVIGYSVRGQETILKRGQFTTLKNQLATVPPNVSRFNYQIDGLDVILFWELPPIEDMAYVRILRNHLGFPKHQFDGSIVYQGLGKEARDKRVLDTYSPVYYTAFVVSKSGAVSSGAVLRVSFAPDANTGTPTIGEPSQPTSDGMEIHVQEATTTDLLPNQVQSNYRIPDLSEIFIQQGDNSFTFANDAVVLSATESFTISIRKESITGNIKTILVSVADPTDTRQRYTFLLKMNNDGSAYEAVISPFAVVGVSWLTLDIYDYQSRALSTYRKQVTFLEGETMDKKVLFPDVFVQNSLATLLIFVLPLIFLLIFLYRHSRKN